MFIRPITVRSRRCWFPAKRRWRCFHSVCDLGDGQNETLRVALDMTGRMGQGDRRSQRTDHGLRSGTHRILHSRTRKRWTCFLDEYERSVQTVTSAEDWSTQPSWQNSTTLSRHRWHARQSRRATYVFVQGEQMQQIAGGFLEVLYQANPKSVGGKLPDANFYYNR